MAPVLSWCEVYEWPVPQLTLYVSTHCSITRLERAAAACLEDLFCEGTIRTVADDSVSFPPHTGALPPCAFIINSSCRLLILSQYASAHEKYASLTLQSCKAAKYNYPRSSAALTSAADQRHRQHAAFPPPY